MNGKRWNEEERVESEHRFQVNEKGMAKSCKRGQKIGEKNNIEREREREKG